MRRIGLALVVLVLAATAGQAQPLATPADLQPAALALQAKDYAAARDQAAALVRTDPKRADAWIVLGAAQQGLQDWTAARDAYAAAADLDPASADAHAGLGLAYARTGDPRAAAERAWIDARLQQCGSCWQAGLLERAKSDIADAMRTAATH